jgi:hypothetical protein
LIAAVIYLGSPVRCLTVFTRSMILRDWSSGNSRYAISIGFSSSGIIREPPDERHPGSALISFLRFIAKVASPR